MEKYREVYRYVQQGESSFRTLGIRERGFVREIGKCENVYFAAK